MTKTKETTPAIQPMEPTEMAQHVLDFAIAAARERTGKLFEGLNLLQNIGGDGGTIEVDGDALVWLAEKFRDDADQIMTDLDFARRAFDGGVYRNAGERYEKEFDRLSGV